jgi:hypothetical protein
MSPERYVHLADFLSSWFHQDFDLNGGTVSEVVAAYRAVTPAAEQAQLGADIERFLRQHRNDTEEAFESVFAPEVRVSTLSGSAEAFMQEIETALRAA